MKNIFPLIQSDFYKQGHIKMYPENMTYLYSNFTPRKSRIKSIDSVVVFGIQYFIKEHLITQWNENFFRKDKSEVIDKFNRYIKYTLGENSIGSVHMEKLHDLGYLPILIKSLEEGTLCPVGVPCITIQNTHKEFAWLVNFLETIISCSIWQSMTSATIGLQYRKILSKYAEVTTGDSSFVPWQGHDFSMRGMSSLESAAMSGAGHLLSFTGTDSIPAIQFLEDYYNANIEKELVGSSVPATEHSVMCVGTKEDEIGTFRKLLSSFPTGILSIVSDTWNLWDVCTKYLPILKEEILARDGKVVIRPDSGDPVDILCGKLSNISNVQLDGSIEESNTPEEKGIIELLWGIFGGTTNEKGYKVLNSHIGAIYGDSITLERAEEICIRLKEKGFASTNVVLGIGSYTYQYNTRDTFGFACKATYAEVGSEKLAIFKDPITDDGTKKSAKGLLKVEKGILYQEVSTEEENLGDLRPVFINSSLVNETSLKDIRERISKIH